jgi:aryl-alcohol dehydrogenase-like predicted oxidoreductase
MQYETLGKTGLNVSAIGLGTWQFGGEWGRAYTQQEVNQIFDAARETGINLIDTAECYGDHLSEQLCGQAINRDRHRWVIATKFGHKFHGNFERTEPRRPEEVQQQLEDSLNALQTEVIDLYQYHSWGSSQFFDDDVLAVLDKARDAGKIRHIGNSVRNKDDQFEQIEASSDRGIEAIQLVYNRLNRMPEENGALESCQRQNLGVLARVPLASGFLTGKYSAQSTFPESDMRSKQDPEQLARTIEQVQEIHKTEVPEDVPIAQWALAWCLAHPAVTCVIPGAKNAEQLYHNAATGDLNLTAVR